MVDEPGNTDDMSVTLRPSVLVKTAVFCE